MSPTGGGFRRASEEERAERMDAAHQQLVAAVEKLTSSDDWLSMLDTARRLPTYSPRNCLLLAAQGAQGMVMGYQAWRKIPAVGGGTCQVAKGATSLKVLAPLTRSVTDTDPDTGRETTGPRVVGYKLISVFDQTSLAAPPDVPGYELLTPVLLDDDEPAPHLWDALAAQIADAGYHLDTSAELAARIAPANGRADYLAKIVCVRPDLPPAQQLKTLTHELAHVLMHGPGNRPPGLTRAVAEVEAESVAYLVTAELGLDSSAYTIPYVTGWADGNTDTVLAAAQRAITTARTITDTLHHHLDLPHPHTTSPARTRPPRPRPAHDSPQRPEPTTPPDDWPDFLDDTPTPPSDPPASGLNVAGSQPSSASPVRELPDHASGEGDRSVTVADPVGSDPVGVAHAVVVATASGAWRLQWEPSRAALTATHLIGPDLPDAGHVSSTLRAAADPDRSPSATTGALEEALGFALPAAVREHLSIDQLTRPPARTTPEPSTAPPRDFVRLYPDWAPAPPWAMPEPSTSATTSTDNYRAAGLDGPRPDIGAHRPTPTSTVLVPGREPLTYAAALAERPPLREWAKDGFGIQILDSAPDRDYPGHQAISYRITHRDQHDHELVIYSNDDLLAPIGSDPASDEALRQAAALAAVPPDDAPLTPAQTHFTRTHAGVLAVLVSEPRAPYPPDTRVHVTFPASPPPDRLPGTGPQAFDGEDAMQVSGVVVQAIGNSGDPVTAYAWRPDSAALPGHPWADNLGHALISPAHHVRPTLAEPDVGLDGWTPDVPLAYGAHVTFPSDDGHPVHAHVLRAYTTTPDGVGGVGAGLEYDVQPGTPGIEVVRIPAHAITARAGTAWPSITALTHAREAADLPLQPGEILTAAGQISYVTPGPDALQIQRVRPEPTTQRDTPAGPPDRVVGDIGGEAPSCASPDCSQDAAVTVSVGWPSGHREITNRCRPCAAQITAARLPRGCGIDITPLPAAGTHLSGPTTATNDAAVQDHPFLTAVPEISQPAPPPPLIAPHPSL